MPMRRNSEHRFCVAPKPAAMPKGTIAPVTPTERTDFMRERTTAINIRVTENEKQRMEKSARLCGLSLSAYLRKLGLGKQVQAVSPPEFYEVYRQLKALKERRKALTESEIDRAFDDILQGFLFAYHAMSGSE